MWEYYSGKTVFITGASGFLGTALAHRLASKGPVNHMYFLCRGGLPRLQTQWGKWLFPGDLKLLLDPGLVTVLEGDIRLPNLGLKPHELKEIQERVDIVIHSASSINLKHPLWKVSPVVVGGTNRVATLAQGCRHLECFVYISTAYANSHLYPKCSALDTPVDETLHPLSHDPTRDEIHEWKDVEEHGTSQEYESHDFAWPYAYAKHLTERLLTTQFPDKLLIIRPSIIGPAQTHPYPGFSLPQSTPSTLLAAGLAFTPSTEMHLATKSLDPEHEATFDEVPVDVVVDRLLVHLAHRTRGPVHAVAGKRARISSTAIWHACMKVRPIPWGIEFVSTSLDWHSPKLHPIAQLFVVLGTSFDFAEGKTELLDRGMREEDKRGLQLFMERSDGEYDFTPRAEQIYAMGSALAKPWPWFRLVVVFFCFLYRIGLGRR